MKNAMALTLAGLLAAPSSARCRAGRSDGPLPARATRAAYPSATSTSAPRPSRSAW
ncbi:hypothetical protein ACPA9J_33715 [Pseudomonas aeruginosa]